MMFARRSNSVKSKKLNTSCIIVYFDPHFVVLLNTANFFDELETFFQKLIVLTAIDKSDSNSKDVNSTNWNQPEFSREFPRV